MNALKRALLGFLVVAGAVSFRACGPTAKYSKLEVALCELLQTKTDYERVEVGIWLTDINHAQIEGPILARYPRVQLEGFRPTRETDPSLYTQIYQELRAARAQAYLAKEQPLKDFIEAHGFQVIFASRAAPLIFAELPKSLILIITARDDVNAVYLSREYRPL